MKLIDVDALLAQMQEYYEKRAKEVNMTGDRAICVTWNDAVFLIKSAPTVTVSEDWIEKNKDRILQAGMEGREIEFRIGGRLFAIREKAQWEMTSSAQTEKKKEKDYFPKGFFSKERPIAKGEEDYDGKGIDHKTR